MNETNSNHTTEADDNNNTNNNTNRPATIDDVGNVGNVSDVSETNVVAVLHFVRREVPRLADADDDDGTGDGVLQLPELIIEYRPKLDSEGRPVPLGPMLERPADAAQVLATLLADEPVESFGVLCLTTMRRVICWQEVSRGRVNVAHVEPREVFQRAFLVNAASIILAHNRPTGEAHASAADLDVTRRMVDAGQLLGVDVLDHLIIGGQDFVCLRAPGVDDAYRRSGNPAPGYQ